MNITPQIRFFAQRPPTIPPTGTVDFYFDFESQNMVWLDALGVVHQTGGGGGGGSYVTLNTNQTIQGFKTFAVNVTLEDGLYAANGTMDINDLTVKGDAEFRKVVKYGSGIFVTETTTARTLTAADHGKVIVCTNASAVAITLNTGLPAYFFCTILQKGAGVVTVGGTATREVLSGFASKTAGLHSQICLANYGTTNTYQVTGQLGV